MVDVIVNLFRRLFSTGRAFKVIDLGVKESLIRALALAINDWIIFVNSNNYEILPDNQNFTEDDATNWERRIGLFVKESNPLETRKDAIARKYGQRGTVLAKNSWRYIQRELQRAGFDVNVIENWFSDGMGGFETRNLPGILSSLDFRTTTYQDTLIYMGAETRTTENTLANSIDPDGADAGFILTDDSLAFSFFICGETYEDPVIVPAQRENEFRQLLLALKPTHSIALLNVIYA